MLEEGTSQEPNLEGSCKVPCGHCLQWPLPTWEVVHDCLEERILQEEEGRGIAREGGPTCGRGDGEEEGGSLAAHHLQEVMRQVATKGQ